MSHDSVEKLFRKKREELPEDFQRKCVEHVKKIDENYWESDSIQDNKVQKVLTTNNTLYSTKCFDYFAKELSKFQTQ